MAAVDYLIVGDDDRDDGCSDDGGEDFGGNEAEDVSVQVPRRY